MNDYEEITVYWLINVSQDSPAVCHHCQLLREHLPQYDMKLGCVQVQSRWIVSVHCLGPIYYHCSLD